MPRTQAGAKPAQSRDSRLRPCPRPFLLCPKRRASLCPSLPKRVARTPAFGVRGSYFAHTVILDDRRLSTVSEA